MQTEITVVERQGLLYVSDGEREYAIPAGGSDMPAASDEGGEGTAPTGGDGVQPQGGQQPEGQEPEGQQPTQGGQGFIEPYLEGIDESLRPTVAEKLEQFRQDQDAQVTRRFEQLRNETEIPVTVYQHLMNDPIGTVQWIADQFEQQRGVNVRQQLLEAWQQSNGAEGEEPGGSDPDDPNRVMTKQEMDEYLERREQEREQQAQQQQQEQQRMEEQTRLVHGWMDEAAKSYGLEFDDADGTPDPLRTAIALQANDLHNAGQAKGKAAIEMVVESVARRFGLTGSGNTNGENGKNGEPRTANGGSAPPQREIDVSDEKQRRARMLEVFAGGQ